MPENHGPQPLLGRSLQIGNTLLRNRVISSPIERNLATESGLITPKYIRYLEARAAGGVALVFTESSYVRADGKARRLQMGIHDDVVLGPLRDLAAAIHRHGALLGVELNHGGRTAQGSVNGFRCVAPSPVPCEVAGGEVPEPLVDEDIRHLVQSYAEAARRCQEAGVDVIMLHGAHGYLINQFMSPRTNLRDDQWAAPARFLTEVINAARDAVPNATLGMRFSAVEGPPGGLDTDQTLAIIKEASYERLDFIDVSAGSYEAGEWIVQPGEWEEGVLAPFAARFRQFGLPVSVVGRITEPGTAERILEDGHADLITVGRALHADPNWAEAAVFGQRYRPCISTNHCIDSLFTGQPVPCSVNPEVSEPPRPRTKELAGVTVVVVGAGPAGLEAARASAHRGANVIVFERESAIGGQVRLSADLRTYPAYHRIIDWYTNVLEELQVEIRLGIEARPEDVMALDPAAVLIATGGRGVLPKLDGNDLTRVHEVREWLRRGSSDLGDEAHIVWGADREGVAVADDLLARGKEVVVVGAQEQLAPDVGRRAKILTVPRLEGDPHATILLDSTIRSISASNVVVKTAGETTTVAGTGPILVSQGLTPISELTGQLREAGYAGHLQLVGDAGGTGGDINNSIIAGMEAARSLPQPSAD